MHPCQYQYVGNFVPTVQHSLSLLLVQRFLFMCMQEMLTFRTSCSKSRSSHGRAAPDGSYGGSNCSSDSSSSSSSGDIKQLQEVVFLCRAKADQQHYQCGDFCKHHCPQQMQVLVTQFTAAVGGSLSLCAAAAAVGPVANVTSESVATAAVQEIKQGVAADQAQRGSAAATLDAGRWAGDIKPRQQQQQQQSAGLSLSVRQLQVGFAVLPWKPVRLHHNACGVVGGRVWGSFGPTEWFQ
jgi:hypothetical protein